MMGIIGAIVMSLGVLLSGLAAWGVLDFPSPLARMHAATKSASLGLALITLGAGIAAGSSALIGVGVLVAGFLFMTAPISGHMLGRSSYAAGQVTGLVHDDLRDRPPSSPRVIAATKPPLSLLRIAVLTGVWILLWRDFSLGAWVAGVVVAISIEAVRRLAKQQSRLRPVGLIRFLAFYLASVVAANARVAWEVVTPSNEQIREAIVAVPLRGQSVRAALLIANAISYTPGTLTIDLAEDPLVLYVHVLHFTTVEEVRADVARLEERVSGALLVPS